MNNMPGSNMLICASPTRSAGSLSNKVTSHAKTTDCMPKAANQVEMATK
jgi:hypothetical protein